MELSAVTFLLNWWWERAIIMWGLETAVALKWPWNKVKPYLGLWKRILTTLFFCPDSCIFLFRGECKQKHTLGGLPISELAVSSKPLIRYGSMLTQHLWIKKNQKPKDLRNWLRKLLIQATSHVQKDPTQSAHSKEPDEGPRGLESWDLSQRSWDRCCFLW